MRAIPFYGTDFPGRNGKVSPRQSLRLLVADDEPTIRELLALVLREDGHYVVLAKDGEEALAKLEAGDGWDVVLTDRCMLGISGDELAGEIKKRFPTLPVILVTGYAGPADPVGLHVNSIDLVLNKPFTLAEIRDGLDFVLRKDGTHLKGVDIESSHVPLQQFRAS